ncbi:MAG: PAS domain-containing protein [Paracoccaceae bacterium]
MSATGKPILGEPLTGFLPESEELFYARLDLAGVLQNCNEAFEKINGRTKDEMIGTPRSQRNHPRMPTLINTLVDQALKRGEPASAYLCRTRPDGTEVWMIGVLLPYGEHVIAINFCPGTDLQIHIAELYAELSRTTAGLPDEEAIDKFTDGLAKINFLHITQFMAVSLWREIQARCIRLDQEVDSRIDAIRRIYRGVLALDAPVKSLCDVLKRAESVTNNMRLQALRLEGQKGPIGAIADNHRMMSHDLSALAAELNTNTFLSTEEVSRAAIFGGAERLVRDLIDGVSAHHMLPTPMSAKRGQVVDGALLNNAAKHFRSRNLEIAARIENGANQLRKICTAIRRQMSALSLTRMMCEMERSKLPGSTDGLASISSILDSSHSELAIAVDEIEDIVLRIDEANRAFQSGFRQQTRELFQLTG